jgi:hypothetical protein
METNTGAQQAQQDLRADVLQDLMKMGVCRCGVEMLLLISNVGQNPGSLGWVVNLESWSCPTYYRVSFFSTRSPFI